MQDSKIANLYKSFDVKERAGYGNQKFKYVSSADVIDRLNKIFNGCWFTEVVHQEVIDDQILIRVRVSIYDEDTEKVFHHEGYGGSIIAKFNSGPNKGKPVDLANSFKAAEAKAIKNACSRWGVGLYLEDHDADEFADNSSNISTKSTSEIKFPEFNINNTPPKFENKEEPVTEETLSEKKPVEEKSKPSGLPDLSGLFGGGSTSTPSSSSSGPPLSNKRQGDKKDKITDIQKAAIKNIIKVKFDNDITYEEMAAKALNVDVADVVPIEDLGYTDAVKLINYGNDSIKNQ